MSSYKIVIVGGGSARGPGLVQAFVEAGTTFSGSELVLYDIDAQALDLVYRLGLRLIQAGGADICLRQCTDRRAALTDADIVLTSFRVGGLPARHLDESIPLEFGIIGHENVGPGGFFLALRTLPVMRAIAEEMSQVAPRALLLNYTNPTNIITEAVSRFTDIQVIGLCDQHRSDAKRVVETLGLHPQSVDYWAAGPNHATWSTRFIADGEDLLPKILEAAEEVEADSHIPPTVRRMFRLARAYGRVPCKYLQYYYFPEETVEEARAQGYTRAQELMQEMPSYWAHYREQLQAKKPVLKHVRGGLGFGDFAVGVMSSWIRNAGDILQLNVPHQGAVPGFPRELVLELPCRVDHHQVTPLTQPALPRDVMGLLEMLAEYQALTAEVGWQGTRAQAVRALASNPLVLSLTRAEAIYARMAAAHRLFLPKRLV